MSFILILLLLGPPNFSNIPSFHIYFVIFMMAKFNYTCIYIQPTQSHFKTLPTCLLLNVGFSMISVPAFCMCGNSILHNLLWVRICYGLLPKGDIFCIIRCYGINFIFISIYYYIVYHSIQKGHLSNIIVMCCSSLLCSP